MDSKYIVSDKYRFVYFVAPKVACSSIKFALLPLFEDLDPAEYRVRQGNENSAIKIHELFADSDYQVRKRQFLKRLDGGGYDNYFKFAFVRNPWDRLVSCWNHKLSEESSPGLKSPARLAERVYSGMPFPEFVEVVADTPDSGANLHFKSQSSMIYGNSNGEDRGPPLADFVGRFENLQADFSAVVERIGAEGKLRLGHLMRRNTESRPYTDFYDDRLRDLVYERYREDIEKFNYSF